ncbi:RNA methyltransferase [Chitinophagaceae bacterium DXS]|nr:RNA methyltransferase [Chitinophagaceae bacterium DXS]
MNLPPSFIASLEGLPGFDKEAFIEVHESGRQVTSIRFNPRKKHNADQLDAEKSELQTKISQQIPWCPYGYYLEERPSFTLDPYLHAGLYYVQEASSMFLWYVLQHTVGSATAELKVLDLCAAPGGKSTLLASYFTDGLLVSNEVIKSRASILVENISKWGCSNAVVTNNDPKDFHRLPGYFDVIVVDAPCSGSGLFRRDTAAIEEWSENNVMLCSQRQQRILADVMPALKENGVFIYSTCSYSKEEDEEILDWLCETFDVTSVQIPVPPQWNIVEVQSPGHKAFGYRFYPDKVDGEGLFMSAFVKKGDEDVFSQRKPQLTSIAKAEHAIVQEWLNHNESLFCCKQGENIIAVPAIYQQDVALLQKHLYLRKAGVTVGAVKGKDLVPHHELALSLLLKDRFEKADLELADALQYLRKADFSLNGSSLKGWVLASYKDANLGWMKVLPNRINNYYPTEWRILKA